MITSKLSHQNGAFIGEILRVAQFIKKLQIKALNLYKNNRKVSVLLHKLLSILSCSIN
tara:strand:+ start:910 stop:1083 length:174 start_codon:yes stop_codon:yes gene_type:complete